MSAVDHPQNPLTAYTTDDGDYSTYLTELSRVFTSVRSQLRLGGYLVVNAANIRAGDVVTPLAWDVATILRSHFDFCGETYLLWDQLQDRSAATTCWCFRKPKPAQRKSRLARFIRKSVDAIEERVVRCGVAAGATKIVQWLLPGP